MLRYVVVLLAVSGASLAHRERQDMPTRVPIQPRQDMPTRVPIQPREERPLPPDEDIDMELKASCIKSWRGDGYCDDINNHKGCQFDGGDCCGNTKPNWDMYCTVCACKDPSYYCAVPSWKGDGYCDDANNVALCDFDGGDCCNNSMPGWNDYCDDCQCLESGTPAPPTAGPTTAAPTAGPTTAAPTAGPTTAAPTVAPPSCLCGIANEPAGRIVGGSATLPNQYPWQVGLVSSTGNSPFCGGTLISNQYVMTAAHCTAGSSASQIKVLLGEHSLSIGSAVDGAYKVSVAQIIQDSAYNSNTLNRDFSILKLSSPVTFTDKVRPACLPPLSDTNKYVGASAIVSGWGTLSSGGSSPSVLNAVTVPVIANDQCGNYGNQILESMMCAGSVSGGIDSCQGDSGGPLTTKINGAYRLIGVVSWGYGCASAGYPGIYARVNYVLPWIYNTIAGSTICPAPASG